MLYLIDPLIALLSALVITLLLVLALGWRPLGASSASLGLALLMALPLFLLVAWLANLSTQPFGPVILERPWIPGLVALLFLSLVFLAIAPVRRHGPSRSAGVDPARPATPADEAAEDAATGITVLFWVLLALLLLAIVLTYWQIGVGALAEEIDDQPGPDAYSGLGALDLRVERQGG